MSTKTIAHFKISGEFVTRHARNRLIERGWEDGLRFLTENIIGISFDLAIAILKGDRRLIGVNRLELTTEESDVKAEWVKQLAYFYNGVVFDCGKYYRPYAFVNNWGPNDLPSRDTDGVRFSGDAWRKRGDPRVTIRSMHYMDDRRHDLVRVVRLPDTDTVDSVTLWKQVDSIPVFCQRFNTLQWQEAMDDFLSNHKLEHRGHAQWYPQEKPDDLDFDEVTAILKGGVPKIKEPEEDAPYVPPEPPPATTEYKDKLGWLLPDGKFYECRYQGHIPLADSLWHHLFKEDKGNAEYEAEKSGWIKFARTFAIPSAGIPDAQWYIFHMVERPITQAQYDVVVQWCKANDEEKPYWLDEKRPQSNRPMFGFDKKPRKDKK